MSGTPPARPADPEPAPVAAARAPSPVPPTSDPPSRPSDGEASAARHGPRPTSAAVARGAIRTLRPHQWVKNVFVLAPVVFAKDLFVFDLVKRAGGAFAVFCLLAGAVYTINDVVDASADRIHPVKRFRPIASGLVPVRLAKAMAAILVVVAAAGALYGPPAFAAVALGYFVLNLAYSLRLKRIAYVDVACIATGFVLRVVAGGYATRIHVSAWLLACTALLALFLGFGKRRHELAGIGRGRASSQRAALEAYSPAALTFALALTGLATVGAYAAYTLDPDTRATFGSDWLWLSTGSVVFGVFRFLFLVRTRPKAESPTQEMLRDVPFVLNLVLWALLVLWIVYKLRPSATP